MNFKRTQGKKTINSRRKTSKGIGIFSSSERNLKKVQCLSSSRTSQAKQKAHTIMELRHKYNLEVLLNCMKMVRSSYYYFEKRSQLVDKYKILKN